MPDEIVIDAKSGMTGAGRSAKEEMLFSEVSEGFHAYGVGHHRHMAELDQEFSIAAGRKVVVTFTPHLMPMNRGILSTIYVRGTRGTIARRPSRDTFKVLREGAVRACAAVRPDAADPACPRLEHDLHRRRQGPRARAAPSSISALDNLVKGASGQAVQNMNLMLGYPETTGPRAGRAVSLVPLPRLAVHHPENSPAAGHLRDEAAGEGQRARHRQPAV